MFVKHGSDFVAGAARVGAVDAISADQVAEILAPDPGLVESVVDFSLDLAGAVANRVSGGLRAIQRFVTQTPVGRLLLTVGFLASSYLIAGICGAVGVCALAAAGLWNGEALLTAEPGQALTSTVIAAALRPYGDLADAIESGDPLDIALSTANAAATVTTVAVPLISRFRPQALSVLCGLRPVVCVSAAEYGPAAQHVADARRNGAPRVLRLDRTGATARRYSALRAFPVSSVLDRDEYPFALSSRRNSLSIQYIDPSSNESLEAYVGNQLRGVPDDARFYVLPIA